MPSTVREYDSIQKKLPEKERDGLLMRVAMYRTITINQKYKGDEERFKEDFSEKFKHSIPQMMFVSLPLIALVMQLLYIRRETIFLCGPFNTSHACLYSHLCFIAGILWFSALNRHYAFLHLFGWITTLISLYIFFYCPIAMYNFYKQGIFKTSLKYFILLFIGCILDGFIDWQYLLLLHFFNLNNGKYCRTIF